MEHYRKYLKEVLSKDPTWDESSLSIQLAEEIVNQLTDQQVARMILALSAYVQSALQEERYSGES